MFNKSHIRRQYLAGIVTEGVQLVASSGGRSDANTIGWHIEEYLLAFATDILNRLDKKTDEKHLFSILISQSGTKIFSNTIAIHFSLKNKQNVTEKNDFLLTAMVKMDKSSDTEVSVTYSGITNKYNLNAKHSAADLNQFKQTIVDSVINQVILKEK